MKNFKDYLHQDVWSVQNEMCDNIWNFSIKYKRNLNFSQDQTMKSSMLPMPCECVLDNFDSKNLSELK